MALLQTIIAWLSQYIGKLVNSVFSWATLLLFGKVPQDRQIILSVVSLLSVAWLMSLLGIVAPRFATYMLTFVSLPAWFNTGWIRLFMLVLLLLLPFVNGVLSLFLQRPELRATMPKSETIFSGCRLTVALSLTLLIILLIAPINKIMELKKQWQSQYIPIIVEPADYPTVVAELKNILHSAGIQTEETKPSIIMQAPIWLLVTVTGKLLHEVISKKLIKLVFADGELEIRPTDLIIRGSARQTNRVVALILSNFSFSRAYLTWTRESHLLEDAMRDLWMKVQAKSVTSQEAQRRADALFEALRKLEANVDEWQTLYRVWLKLKLDIWETYA